MSSNAKIGLVVKSFNLLLAKTSKEWGTKLSQIWRENEDTKVRLKEFKIIRKQIHFLLLLKINSVNNSESK